ncbi:hypothetical protein Pmani_028256 [Petrolisthes manimaculis]|uniref:Carboxylic ester hydrolase n=1 Tax=Petrolisthes manimaculis TaxID=1843537 RepID=A0AAE1P206_9EUCA|nr:hypothetical protein Pmani_028256 [Petrolisthes manimaculis]
MRLQFLGALLFLFGAHALKSPLQAVVDIPPSVIHPEKEKISESSPVKSEDEGGTRLSTAPPVYHQLPVGDLGTVRGVMLESFFGRSFYSFMSLPYAQPPVVDLRFKYPVAWEGPLPEETDDGEYDATWLRARCPQNSLILPIVAGREDCLTLSIYTPMVPGVDKVESGLPVMLFIHGGAYMTGDATLYVPTKLMDRDVTVVVIQYRLSLLGFLAGGGIDAPGNMGLMDQVEALRWVQKYISYFGGDPDLVTVFGQSAGGASSSWMHLTPLTQDSNNNGNQLLHRAVPQSGSALELWTIDEHPDESFLRTAQMTNCSDGNIGDKLDCMMEMSFQDVVKASNNLYLDDRLSGGLGFRGLSPVIQSDLNETGLELVIPKDPREMLDAGEFLHVPIMYGSVRDEGSLVVGLSWTDYMVPLNISIKDEEFCKFEIIPLILQAFGLSDKNGALANTMRQAYLPNAEMGDWYSMVGGLVDMGGVMFLKSGLWELVTRAHQAVPDLPIYFYSWEYDSDDHLFNWIFSSTPDIPVEGGIGHGDELIYLFHLPGSLDEEQQTMVRRMTLMWTNFAKYGNPTPAEHTPEEAWEEEVEDWTPFTADVPTFMLIKEEFTVEVDFTTRWNYHRDLTWQNTTTTTTTTTAPDSIVSRDEYERVMDQRDDFKIATAILGAAMGCVILIAVVLVAKKQRAANAIV